MSRNRFSSLLESYRLPQPPQAPVTSEGFVVCPLPVQQALSLEQMVWRSALYQLAFEQTQAQLRPSLPERDLLAMWN
jgi:hypothetical protein